MTQPDPHPHHLLAQAHHERGLALAAQGDFAGALDCFTQILALVPDDANAAINQANMLQKLGRGAEAIAAYGAVLAREPDNALAHFNLGRALAAEGQPHAALVHYNHVLALQPHNAEAHWAKGMTQLMLGEFREGWAAYEARWSAPSFGHAPRNFPRPMWDGVPLAGKAILVHAEQGFGDTIQFCRYVALLAAQGARVLLVAQPELKSLLGTSLPCTVLAPGDQIPVFDVHCALMSLPHLMRTTVETIPSATPYLTPPADKIARWQQLLGPKQKLRVGLAWSGRRTHIDDARRSIDLGALRPLVALDAEFHALQIDISDADRATLAQSSIRSFEIDNRDFGDAAAHVAAMDVVVTVDTSLAHLAGALNKPTWIMLAYKSDFRWMMNRRDSPWYPTARLFRQSQKNQWGDVIARLRDDLKTLL